MLLFLLSCFLISNDDLEKRLAGAGGDSAVNGDADTDGDTDADTDSGAPDCDADGDGFESEACGGTDCDDAHAEAHPGGTEVCDGLDNDCDGETDEDVTTTLYADADGDGFGDPAAPGGEGTCDAPDGWAPNALDCNDADPAVNPDAEEVCDGVDNDCDGEIDGASAVGAVTTWADADGDGFGDPDAGTTACPGDGPPGVDNDGDCDDTDAAVNPDAVELCNGVDDDCDGSVDPSSSADASTWYADADGDGFGGSTYTVSCSVPTGYTSASTDCDDSDPTVNPDATEVCDGIDNDCDGSIDPSTSADASTWYRDSDGDGYGLSTSTRTACTQPSGYVADATDCDDGSASVNPAASESCNDVDDDCNGLVDDGLPTATYYADSDSDGYGDAAASVTDCAAPKGYVSNDDDCDDSNAASYPGAAEACDGEDNDCNSSIDDGASCPCAYSYTTGSSAYFFCALSYSWSDAEAYCDSYGYDLWTVDDASEETTVSTYALLLGPLSAWWLGLTDEASEGSWVWVSGSSSTYDHWAAGEPSGGTTQNCAVFNAQDSNSTNDYLGWYDAACSRSAYFVCEAN